MGGGEGFQPPSPGVLVEVVEGLRSALFSRLLRAGTDDGAGPHCARRRAFGFRDVGRDMDSVRADLPGDDAAPGLIGTDTRSGRRRVSTAVA